MSDVRVRFAPSPTGDLHIGGARTALFNWLFARHTGGTYILRVEDTDEARSTEESVGSLLEGLLWLGLDWDEGPEWKTAGKEKGGFGPYFQMQRLELYRDHARRLVDAGKAYDCFCTPEELEARREAALKAGRPPKYDGRCRRLTQAQVAAFRAEGRRSSLRFRMPEEGTTSFTDQIRGEVSFETALLDDFVLVKSTGGPTYNFAVVVDDHAMRISHVIRGEDHLSNTPRQLHLYRAFGWEPPVFAHLTMILGPDGSRLSKRHGAASVLEFRRLGYLPEALVNYLSLLGWGTPDSQQMFSREELIAKFSLERCTKSGAVYDPQKMVWMNGEHIRRCSPQALAGRCLEWLERAGLVKPPVTPERFDFIRSVVTLEQEKYKTLAEVPRLVEFFFSDEVDYDPEAVARQLGGEAAGLLAEVAARLEAAPEFTASALEEAIRGYAKEKGLKTSQVFHPVRVAVSGRTQGPTLFGMLALLGRERTLKRLRGAPVRVA